MIYHHYIGITSKYIHIQNSSDLSSKTFSDDKNSLCEIIKVTVFLCKLALFVVPSPQIHKYPQYSTLKTSDNQKKNIAVVD